MGADDTHDHNHSHDHTEPPSDLALQVQALESLLVEKGLVDREALDALVDRYETKVGPQNGAKVVAKAWTDPDYRVWLLDDATSAIESIHSATPRPCPYSTTRVSKNRSKKRASRVGEPHRRQMRVYLSSGATPRAPVRP